MYIDKTDSLKRELKHLIYGEPEVLGRMIEDLADKINMMSDRLEVVTELYSESLAFHRNLKFGRFSEKKPDLVQIYLNHQR